MARSRREVLQKVVKMLRLARAAGTEAEAHTALSLAQKLMYAHGLAAHEVEGPELEGREAEELEPIEESVIDHASSRLGWREYLAAVVAENFRCAYILSRGKSAHAVTRLVFVGRAHDVGAGSEAYRAATIAGETLAERYVQERPDGEHDAARQAYLSGFLAGLDRRFRDNVAETALVLRLEDEVVARARSLTNAGDAQGVGLRFGDHGALRAGYDEGFAFGDPTKRIR